MTLTWILIAYLGTSNGGSPLSAAFATETACQDAITKLKTETSGLTSISLKFAFCTPTGAK
jgi:hypothetical protein